MVPSRARSGSGKAAWLADGGSGGAGPRTVQAAGGRFCPEGKVKSSEAEGCAREELEARRPLKDMHENSWELPAWGPGGPNGSQEASAFGVGPDPAPIFWR